MSDMDMDIKVSFRLTRNDWDKLQFLTRHDDTTMGQQLRQAVKKYLHNRKKTVYGQNPLEG